jgi:hypothetical protein
MFDFDVKHPLLLGIAIENNDFEYVDKHLPNYDYIKLKKLYNKFFTYIIDLANNINMKLFIFQKYKKIFPICEYNEYYFENRILSYVLDNYDLTLFSKLNHFMHINNIRI